MADAQEIQPQEAQQLVEGGTAVVVDVRDEDEYEAGHIAGAKHVPFDRLNDEAAGVAKGNKVLFYCKSGDRSATAASAFAGSGFDAYSISGGLEAWAEAGLPLDPEDGTVAERNVLPPR
jgi:rhodanese-related sulfurtransferase